MAKIVNGILLFSAMGLLLGCGTSQTAASSSAASIYLGVCQVTNAQSSTVVCLDFPQNATTNSNACTAEENNYSSQGASSSVYEGINGTTSGVTVSCAQMNSSLTLVASCTLTDRVIRYYSTVWTSTASQTDCTGRNGSYLAN